MPNENCLKGFKCPWCSQTDKFKIEITTWATFTDDGSDDFSDLEFDDSAACKCGCGWSGKVGEARTDEQGDDDDDGEQVMGCPKCGEETPLDDWPGYCPECGH